MVLALATSLRADVTVGTGLVRHAPTINGSKYIEGSLQMLLGEQLTINGSGGITNDLLVPGTPTVRRNGAVTIGAILAGSGSASPTGYTLMFNGKAFVGRLITRTDPVAMPSAAVAAAPTGTRSVIVNGPNQSVGSYSTVRNLTINGNGGNYTIPAGSYGDFIINGGSSITLGAVGATTPFVYNFQSLTLNGSTQIIVLSPVVVILKNSLSANGVIGAGNHPDRLKLTLATGSVTLNGGCNIYGVVTAPSGHVIINGSTKLEGGLYCDRLTLNGSGVLRLVGGGGGNTVPTANP